MQDPTEIQPEPSNDVEITRPTLAEMSQPIYVSRKVRHPFASECPPWCLEDHNNLTKSVWTGYHRSYLARIRLSCYLPWRRSAKRIELPRAEVYVAQGGRGADDPFVMLRRYSLRTASSATPEIIGPMKLTPNEAVRVAAALVRAADIAAGTDPVGGQS